MAKILLADDDKNVRVVLLSELSEAGHDVTDADTGLTALELLGVQDFDVLLLDLNMPRMGGMEVLEKLQSLEIPTEVIVLTAHGSVALAVAAMKLGAYDFLVKPFKIAELLAVLEKAVEKKRLRLENVLLKTRIQRQEKTPELVSRSPAMHAILATVEKVAASDYSLLVEGESGVGKELIARALHRSSARAEGPFIPLNCGAVSQSIIESELFGYEKGAFTGAQARKLGLLEIAHRGTFFLDEIGEMPPALQVKFLRILETSAFFRVGGVKEVKVDIRCVSATNKDLKAEVAAGRFIGNALDAMGEQGTLSLETGSDQQYGFVRIGDTGAGIRQENLGKIFEPFFTTKADQGGTGLGLSIARKIVLNHHGRIDVVSEPGQGTTFTIELPLSPSAPR